MLKYASDCRSRDYLSDIILGILIGLFVWWTIPFLKKRLGLDPVQAVPRRIR